MLWIGTGKKKGEEEVRVIASEWGQMMGREESGNEV